MSTFAIPFETRVCPERDCRKARGRELKKFSKKIWRKENKFLPVQPRKNEGLEKRAGRPRVQKRSLKRLKESTRKQVPKQNERERRFLIGNESSGSS